MVMRSVLPQAALLVALLAQAGSAFAAQPAAAEEAYPEAPEPTTEPESADKPSDRPSEEQQRAGAAVAEAGEATGAQRARPDSPQADAAARPRVARLHHAPVSVATSHQPFPIQARILHPELARRALLVYQTGRSPEQHEVEFKRGLTGPYVAVVPHEAVNPPWISYCIEIEGLDGTRVPVFASRTSPHVVHVPEDRMDMRESALDEQLGGRRLVFSARAEFVDFGESEVQENIPGSFPQAWVTRSVPDWFYRIEGGYTYRPLRAVTEFSIRVGMVRGRSPVELQEDEVAPGVTGDDRFKVGLNYGSPGVRFRIADSWHLDLQGLVSVTEVGFSAGAGGALLIGNPYASKLVLGFETVEVFGTRLFSRLDIVAGEGVMLSPMVEATDMPHANKYGVRLLGEVGFDAGAGFGVAVRGGYQARKSTSGGPSGGAMLSYAF